MGAALLGSQLLVKAIEQAGISRVYSLSGNHIMPLYDAIIDSGLKLLHTRHEAAAVHMADAWARLTGEAGVAMVTGGPGHANAVAALYTASMSESPVILLSGHAPLSQAGWGAFQEIDQVAMTRPVVKAAWRVSSPDAIAEDFAHACRLALSGRRGPVHLSLPIDILQARAPSAILPGTSAFQAERWALSSESAQAILNRLARAKHPMVLVGPEGCTRNRRQALERLASALNMPVIATESPRGVNDPSLGGFASLLNEADCVLLLGKRLDFTLDFGRAPAFSIHCRFIQIDADRAEFERSGQAVGERLELTVHADVSDSLDTLSKMGAERRAPRGDDWPQRMREAVAYRPTGWLAPHDDGEHGLHPALLCAKIQTMLDQHPDSVLVIDGGEFGQWAQACLTARHRIINGAAGAIGAALPMAIAAKQARPDALVVAVMGDGSFGFHCAEFDTAVRAGVPILCIVGNDACWNAEYQIQLRDYGPDRTQGCELLPTHYEKVAISFGGHGETVDSLDALSAALLRAAASGLPACVNIRLHGLPAPHIRRDS